MELFINLIGVIFSKKTFCQDPHLSDLLVFAPKTDLHNHPLYVSGDIILQVILLNHLI